MHFYQQNNLLICSVSPAWLVNIYHFNANVPYPYDFIKLLDVKYFLNHEVFSIAQNL